MKVQLKCFSKLVNPDTCDFRESTTYDIEDGGTVEELAERAKVPREGVKIAFVNNRKVDLDTPLAQGDQVALTPAVGGM